VRNRKRHFALGFAAAAVVAVALTGWIYAKPASAHPGASCTPEAGHCSSGPATTAKKVTTTTAKKATATTAKKTTPTTAKAKTTTTKKSTTTTKPKATTTTAVTAGAPASTTATTSPQPAGEAGFSDVPATHPYYKQIGDLVARQLMVGDSDGTFKPDDPVTREAFAMMIVKALDLQVTGDETCAFTDVTPGQTADPFFPDKYVAVCASNGITIGVTPSTFEPAVNLTRQQLITMVARAAKLADPPADFTPPFDLGQFFPEEHFTNARKAASTGLLDGLQGIGSGFDFMGSATRGEVSVMLYNLLQQ
jgi:S-layer homology domain